MATEQHTQSMERTVRPWGWFETVSETPGTKIKRIGVLAGQQISLQRHSRRSEHWVVVQGQATVTLGQEVLSLGVGQSCDIAVGQVHRLANQTDSLVEIVEVQFGSYLSEDDIERLQDDYGRR